MNKESKLAELTAEDIYQLGIDDCKRRAYDETMAGCTPYLLGYSSEYARQETVIG